jgi:hypothetical protein
VKAIEVTRFVALGDEAKKALTPEMSLEDYIEALLIRELHPDALQFIAHSLPKRQAVWWALGCVKQVAPPELPPEQETAVKMTERWIAEPTEENRQAAFKAAEAADTSTPAGITALAAYYSDALPATADPEKNAKAYFITAKLVSAAVMLAAASDPEQVKARFGGFASKGAEVVKRTSKG